MGEEFFLEMAITLLTGTFARFARFARMKEGFVLQSPVDKRMLIRVVRPISECV